jgi:hypothetical protein
MGISTKTEESIMTSNISCCFQGNEYLNLFKVTLKIFAPLLDAPGRWPHDVLKYPTCFLGIILPSGKNKFMGSLLNRFGSTSSQSTS